MTVLFRLRSPESSLEAFRPEVDGPWDLSAAAHLLRRTGFSPSLDELKAAHAAGPARVIESRLGSEPESERYLELDALATTLKSKEDIESVRGWWLMRMVHTRRPLNARIAVFWHNHFATSNVKVQSPGMMLAQLRTIESLGLGSFEQLLLALSRDPAMIAWLDGDANIKGRPNENYARELFELFSLGVGNYSEKDIKEAARAFTGWHQRQGEYRFFPHNHDTGPKTIFGKSGSFDGDDVVKLAVSQPACARFLAMKLLHEFVSPRPSDELVAAFAGTLRERNLNVGESLGALFGSRAFFAAEHRNVRIKSPVEFAVGVVRSLEMRVKGRQLSEAVTQMGQRLLEPPSVKGWDGHRAWLDSSTMLVRLNSVQRAVRATGDFGLDPGTIRARYSITTPDDMLAYCREVSFAGRVPPAIEGAVSSLPQGNLDSLAREALHLLLSAPEYQMC